MKIKTSHVHSQNTVLNFPVVGKKKVKDGIVDLPDEVAAMLVKGDDWEYLEPIEEEEEDLDLDDLDSEKTKAKVEDDEDEDEGEEEDVEDKKVKKIESDATKKKTTKPKEKDELDNMDLKGLIDIAKGGKIKGWERFKTNEKGLRIFIRKQLKK